MINKFVEFTQMYFEVIVVAILLIEIIVTIWRIFW